MTQISYCQKSFLNTLAIFSYLSEWNGGLVFFPATHLLTFFSIKFPSIILWPRFNIRNFLLLKILNNLCFQFQANTQYYDDVTNIRIHFQSASSINSAMVYREKKDRKQEVLKIEFIKNKMSFSDKIKIIFHNYFRIFFWWNI